uniref:Solute carrier family 2, facilitated glucose transporter member 12 n=1 Tax=Tetraodon nigroviridis TaxID=99883 RepID=H3DFX3_TETNG
GCSWLVVVAAVAASLSGLMLGYELGLTSGVLLQLREVLSLSCSQQELLVSSQLVGALIACLAGGPVLDHYGRRCSLILSAAMVVGGSVVLVAVTSLIALVLGRVIVGMGIALSGTAACLYIAEISPMERRGLLVTLYELMVVLGVMMGFSCSFAFATVSHGWAYTFGLAIPLALLQMSALLFLPPSPRFLVTKNKVEEARRVLVRIQCGADEHVDTELWNIQAGLKEESGHSFMELFSANLRSRMLTGVALFFFLQVTGQPNILSYASPLLKSVGFNSVAAATLASTGLGVVKVVFTIPAVLLVDRVGPKKFLCVGAVVMGLTLITLGLTLQSHTQLTSLCRSTAAPNHTDSAWNINHTRWDANSSLSGQWGRGTTAWAGASGRSAATKMQTNVSSSLKVASLISLLVYVAAFSVSLGPMVYVVISEIFPMGVRGRAASVVAAVNWAVNLLISMSFLTITEKIGVPNVMFFHSAMCFALLVFVILCVPETKGLTLEEISKELAKNNYLSDALCFKNDHSRLL